MDPLALIWVGIILALIVAFWLVGRYYPGSGLDQIGQRSAREIVEQREALEADDLEQMLGAYNARRRARGERELTSSDLELRVAQDMRERDKVRQRYYADQELDQLLEATNARRRARGEPVRTREDLEREFGPRSADAEAQQIRGTVGPLPDHRLRVPGPDAGPGTGRARPRGARDHPQTWTGRRRSWPPARSRRWATPTGWAASSARSTT